MSLIAYPTTPGMSSSFTYNSAQPTYNQEKLAWFILKCYDAIIANSGQLSTRVNQESEFLSEIEQRLDDIEAVLASMQFWLNFALIDQRTEPYTPWLQRIGMVNIQGTQMALLQVIADELEALTSSFDAFAFTGDNPPESYLKLMKYVDKISILLGYGNTLEDITLEP